MNAGDLTLDLVNTVAWRLDPTRRDDRLSTGPDLARWASALTRPSLPEWWTAALEPVRSLREHLADVLVPVATGRTPDLTSGPPDAHTRGRHAPS